MNTEIKEKLINCITESIEELQQGIEEMQELRVKFFSNPKRRERIEAWIANDQCQIMDYQDELKKLKNQ